MSRTVCCTTVIQGFGTKRELKQVQKSIDRCYRGVWNDRNEQPLIGMSEREVNMVDVRENLGVRSVA